METTQCFLLFSSFQPPRNHLVYVALCLAQKVQHQSKSLDNLRNQILTIRRNLMNNHLTTNGKFYMPTQSRKYLENYIEDYILFC